MNFLQVQEAVKNILNNYETRVVADIKLFIQMAQETLEKELIVPDMRAYPTQLSAPVISSVTGTTGTIPAGTVSYRVTALDTYGETLGSTAVTLVLAAPGGVVITWGAVTNATTYKVYGRTGSAEAYIATVSAPTVTYTDNGSITPSGALPTLNTTYSLRTGQNSFPVPSDYISLMYLGFTDLTTGWSYPYIDRYSSEKYAEFSGIYPTTATGRPSFYTRQGNNFVFDCYADKDYAIHIGYEKKITALTTTSADNATNYWTNNASKLLIYRACVESYLDDPQYQRWVDIYTDELRRWEVYLRKEELGGVKPIFVPLNYFS